jgi:hypothetical protein
MIVGDRISSFVCTLQMKLLSAWCQCESGYLITQGVASRNSLVLSAKVRDMHSFISRVSSSGI